ncbi:MAG: SHOCT domain-containing protein [Clostridium sp.]|nr:SHOCT domain-containing protein [Clostridium sp.]
MTICFVSCIYFLLLIWEIFNFDFLDNLLWKFVLTCILLSISFGHMCLLLLINSTEKIVKIFRNGTITLSIIMDLFLLIEIFVETELNWKLLSILAILMVLGTIVTPLLDKLNSRTNSSNSHTNDDKYLKLEQLKKLLDDNAITQEEYETEKNKILNGKKA